MILRRVLHNNINYNTFTRKSLHTTHTLRLFISMSSSSSSSTSSSSSSSSDNHEKYTNALIHETSPYLLQHAHNPVNWYPWTRETIEKAQNELKPIFLSVGYSTCHWCHVMERESFENEQIAKVMNDHFINIKVDREERPDVDRVYMTFVQATTGSGGWPMSVFLTPDLKPFFGGTYFPPSSFISLLGKLAQMWNSESGRRQVTESGTKVMKLLQTEFTHHKGGSSSSSSSGSRGNQLIDKAPEYLEQAMGTFVSSFDKRYGGFGGAPKFPQAPVLNFLFRMYYRHPNSKQLLHTCLYTLDMMSMGGIYDHLGGGFHRYSVDREWHVPHFEKMTYDQGQLISCYCEAYQITKKEKYAKTARQVIEYMTRDMTLIEESDSSMAAFYSAEDADSFASQEDKHRKREGAFYVWSNAEIYKLLDKRDAEIFCYLYDVRPSGNVRQPDDDLRGKNVLIQRHSLQEASTQFATSEDNIVESLERSKTILFEYRNKRPRPHLDDKIITGWNALMISGLAKAAQALNDTKYAQQAARVAKFIKQVLYNSDSKILYRTYRHKSGGSRSGNKVEAFLSDYTFMIAALLDLYEADGHLEWLQWALELQQTQDSLFLDQTDGGYFEVTGQDPHILLRMKEYADSSEPSGNSIAAMNLIRLSQFTTDEMANKFMNQADLLFNNSNQLITRAPEAIPQLLCALDERIRPGKHFTIAYDKECIGPMVQEKALIFNRHLPSKSIFYMNRDDPEEVQFVRENVPYLSQEAMSKRRGTPTVYICQDKTCGAPIKDIAELDSALQQQQK